MEKEGKNYYSSKQISKETNEKDGKKTSVMTTTIIKPDGSKVEEKIEETDDGKGNVNRKKFINGVP